MSYYLDVFDHLDYLRIRFSGLWNHQNAHRLTDEIAAVVFESRHKRILLDFRLDQSEESTIVHDYQEASYAAHLFMGKVFKVAILIRDVVTDSVEFFEDVAHKKGLNLRHFTGEQPAYDWLLK